MKQVSLKIVRNTICYYYKNKKSPLRISTGINVSKKDIEKDGNIKKMFLNKYPEILFRLNYVNNWIIEFERKEKEHPPIELIKRKITGKIEKKYSNKQTLMELFTIFYDFKTKNINKKSSLKDYISFRNSINDYQKYFNLTLLIFDIDINFIDNYKVFMKEDRKPKKNIKLKTKGKLNDNTLIKRFNVLSTFFHWLVDEGVVKEYPNVLNKTDVKKQKVYKTYLTSEEIIKFYNVDFKDETKNRVRDIFVFSCHTGMRFSDFTKLTKLHFVEKNGFTYVKKKSEKVEDEFLVPLTDISNEIRLRHNHNFKFINQVFNRILKKIIEKSDLFNDEFLDENKNVKYKRYEKITSHTGRHSFITNLVNANVSINYIMGMTGHKKLETLNRYIQNKEPQDNKIVNKVFNKRLIKE